MNFFEILELDFVEYLLYLRDGFIYRLTQTEKGNEYLDKCWILEQTKPDRTALRKTFWKEAEDGGKYQGDRR